MGGGREIHTHRRGGEETREERREALLGGGGWGAGGGEDREGERKGRQRLRNVKKEGERSPEDCVKERTK